MSLPNINPQTTALRIEDFIREKHAQLKRQGAIIGLSGGLDSAVVAYLTVRSLGKEAITLLYLPDRDSNPQHRRDAKLIAQELGITLAIQDITPALKALDLYSLLPLKYIPGRRHKEWLVKLGKSLIFSGKEEEILSKRLEPKGDSWVAKGNTYICTKHRVRMVQLYILADVHNLMVVGAANKTELLTGTFTKWGCDHCADVMPIIHLYRSQLPPLAEYIGIPERVRSKPADPDILPGLNDKEVLLGPFREVDQILWGLENGVPRQKLVERYGEKRVAQITRLKERSRSMRESPCTLEDHALPEEK